MSEQRLIDANALKMAFEEDGHLSAYIEEYIDDAPAVDAVPVVHAEWIHDINNLYGCSACLGRETMSHKKMKRFCPNCGAQMDAKEDENAAD